MTKQQENKIQEIISNARSSKRRIFKLKMYWLENIPAEVFELDFIEELYIEGTRINTIPDEIGKLKKLQKLYANSNEIEYVSENIFEIESLQSLSLAQNALQSLPEVKCLHSLVHIDASSNHLRSLPRTFFNLNKLKSIVLDDNDFSLFDYPINQLKELVRLDLGYNSIEKIDNIFDGLNELKVLGLSNNFFKEIDPSIFNLPVLTHLNLSFNKLTIIPAEIDRLKKLKHLNLAGNALTKFPVSVLNLKSLENLILRNNSIVEIPNSIVELSSLVALDLRNNKIEMLPQEIASISSLKNFLFDGNNLSDDSPFNIFGLTGVYQLYNKKIKENVLLGLIKISKEFVFAFQQYLVGFERYLQNTKNIEVGFTTKRVNDGLELMIELDEFTPRLEQEIGKAFNEYFSLISPEYIDQAEKRIEELARENEFLKLELRTKVNNFKNDIDRETTKNQMLQRENNLYYKLLLKSFEQKIILQNTNTLHGQVSQSQSISVEINLNPYNEAFFNLYHFLLNQGLADESLKEEARDLKDTIDKQDEKIKIGELENNSSFKKKLERFLKKSSAILLGAIKIGKDIKPVIESLEKLKELAYKLNLHHIVELINSLSS